MNLTKLHNMEIKQDPAKFYTGLVADLYEPLASGISSSDRFAEFLSKAGDPALEVCCGTGQPLLDLVESGFNVEGLDASPDMLKICKSKAVNRGLAVVLYQGKMQQFETGKRYGAVYIANGSITLLQSDDDVRMTLNTIARHLEPTGLLLVDLACPDVTNLRSSIGQYKEKVVEENVRIRVGMIELESSSDQRNLRMKLRYERIRPDGETESVDRDWYRRVWNVDQFAELLTDAGFQIDSVTTISGDATQVCAKLSGDT
ncbi:MAG: class I SAM-dependent methyltransferase [Pseudomonadales bacterium]|nr:class I SAM-dependent methyltransferase [Pseudomonadales bacterium]